MKKKKKKYPAPKKTKQALAQNSAKELSIRTQTEADLKHQQALISLAVEAWRMVRNLESAIAKLDSNEQKRYTSQIQWFIKKMTSTLESANLRLVNLEGQEFDSGLPATPLNIDDFAEEDKLSIAQMLEPVLLDQNGQIVHTGTVILQRLV